MAVILPNTFYHFYNRGNNEQQIFFSDRNYLYFRDKFHHHLSPHVHILAYCLMPNHFHFLLYTKENVDAVAYSNALKIALSSYTRALQKQEKFTGSLFQQRSKKKEVVDRKHSEVCLHYIHQNPVKSGFAEKLEDWKWSSFMEYWKDEKGICDSELGRKLIPMENFYERSYYALGKSRERWAKGL